MTRLCSFEGCTNVFRAKNLCASHWDQQHQGNPLKPLGRTAISFEERFWQKVQKTDSCWVWIGSKDKQGYGNLTNNRQVLAVHRVSYEMHVGPIPAGLVIDHKCFNHSCVNPEHLEPVTRKVNGENRAGLNKNNISGVRGVSWHKAAKKWAVQVHSGGKNHYGGLFVDIEDAKEARITLENKVFGWVA